MFFSPGISMARSHLASFSRIDALLAPIVHDVHVFDRLAGLGMNRLALSVALSCKAGTG